METNRDTPECHIKKAASLISESPCYAVFKRHINRNRDAFDIYSHCTKIGEVKRRDWSDFIGSTIQYITEKYVIDMIARIRKESEANNMYARIYAQEQMMHFSGNVFASKLNAIRYAVKSLAEDNRSSFSETYDIIICSVIPGGWALPYEMPPFAERGRYMVGETKILDVLYVISEETPWFPYPDVSPDNPGSYLITEQNSSGVRFVPSSSSFFTGNPSAIVYFDGNKFTTNDKTIVAWMPVPAPYSKTQDIRIKEWEK